MTEKVCLSLPSIYYNDLNLTNFSCIQILACSMFYLIFNKFKVIKPITIKVIKKVSTIFDMVFNIPL